MMKNGKLLFIGGLAFMARYSKIQIFDSLWKSAGNLDLSEKHKFSSGRVSMTQDRDESLYFVYNRISPSKKGARDLNRTIFRYDRGLGSVSRIVISDVGERADIQDIHFDNRLRLMLIVHRRPAGADDYNGAVTVLGEDELTSMAETLSKGAPFLGNPFRNLNFG
jgi:hypothetical protein